MNEPSPGKKLRVIGDACLSEVTKVQALGDDLYRLLSQDSGIGFPYWLIDNVFVGYASERPMPNQLMIGIDTLKKVLARQHELIMMNVITSRPTTSPAAMKADAVDEERKRILIALHDELANMPMGEYITEIIEGRTPGGAEEDLAYANKLMPDDKADLFVAKPGVVSKLKKHPSSLVAALARALDHDVFGKDIRELTDTEWEQVTWMLYGYYLGGANNHKHVAQSLKEIGKVLTDTQDPRIVVSANKEGS